MYRTTSDHFYKKVGIAKEFRNDVLCFFFHGASKDLVRQTFSRLKDMCSSEVTTENVHGMTNGRCHKNIVVKVTASGLYFVYRYVHVGTLFVKALLHCADELLFEFFIIHMFFSFPSIGGSFRCAHVCWPGTSSLTACNSGHEKSAWLTTALAVMNRRSSSPVFFCKRKWTRLRGSCPALCPL